jgi:hypothetical protein
MHPAKVIAVLAAALALAVTGTPAHAAPIRDRTAPHAEVSVSWDGRGGHHTVPSALFGDVTVVPGDTARATILVRNDGPTDGILAVSIVNTQLHPHGAGDHDSLAQDLRINGMPVDELVRAPGTVHAGPIAEGATAAVPISYDFPAGAVSGNRADVGLVEVSFDVHLRITADSSRDLGGAPGADIDSGGPEATGPTDGIVAQTGGALAPTAGWLVPLALVLTVVATVAAQMRHRGKAEQR